MQAENECDDGDADSFLESFMMEQDMMFHVFEEEEEMMLSNAPPPISLPLTITMPSAHPPVAKNSGVSKESKGIKGAIDVQGKSKGEQRLEQDKPDTPEASYYTKEAERKKRRVMIKKEMNQLLRLVQEYELTQPMDPLAAKALQEAAQSLCYKQPVKQKQPQHQLSHHQSKSEVSGTVTRQTGDTCAPSIKTTILDESLINEAERLFLEWNSGANEFPLEYGIALRSVVFLSSESVGIDDNGDGNGLDMVPTQQTAKLPPSLKTSAVAANGESRDRIDLARLPRNSKALIKPGREENDSSTRIFPEEETGDESDESGKVHDESDQQERIKKIDRELDELLRRTENQKLSKPMVPKAVSAFRRAAHKLCYTEQIRDVWTNEVLYIPNVTDAIINANLIFEAEKLFEEVEKQRQQDSQIEDYVMEEFPLEYGIALQAIAMPSSPRHSSFSHLAIEQRNQNKLKNNLGNDNIQRMAASMMDLGIGGNSYVDFTLDSFTSPHKPIEETPEVIIPLKHAIDNIYSTPEATPRTPVEAHSEVRPWGLQPPADVDEDKDATESTDMMSELQMRHQMIDKELNKILLQVQEHEELTEPFRVEVVEALQRAAQKVCFVKKYYDAIKDVFVYFPSLKSSILDESLTDEAVMYLIDSEFPMEFGIALRSAVSASTDDADDDNLEYMQRLAMDVDIDIDDVDIDNDDVDDAVIGAKDASTADIVSQEGNERLAEGRKRIEMIKSELGNFLLKIEEEEELEEPIEEEVVEALHKAAYTVCFVKKYYDVIKDEFLYFPTVRSTILNETLTDKAAECFTGEDDAEFPLEVGIALRSVVTVLGDGDEADDIDLEYMERLALDVDIGDYDASDGPLCSGEYSPTEVKNVFAETESDEKVEKMGGAADCEGVEYERQNRLEMIHGELDGLLLKVKEEEDVEAPDDAVEALRKAAFKICFRKKYYDVINDVFIYFPSLKTTILNETLTDTAVTYSEFLDNEFPIEFGIALRSVVAGCGDGSEEDGFEIEYMERLAIDVDIGNDNEADITKNISTSDSTSDHLPKEKGFPQSEPNDVEYHADKLLASDTSALKLELQHEKSISMDHSQQASFVFDVHDIMSPKKHQENSMTSNGLKEAPSPSRASFAFEGHSSYQQRQERKEERRRRRFLRESRKKHENFSEDLSKSMSVFKILGGDDGEVDVERNSERKMRQQAVDSELDELIAQVESRRLCVKLSNGILSEAANALKTAAMQICYVKKFYEAFKDHFIYFPTVHATIVDKSLTKAAKNYMEHFPPEFGEALRSVAVNSAIDDHKHQDHSDDMLMMEYAERLAIDVDILEGDDDEDFAASDSKIAYGEIGVEGGAQVAILSNVGNWYDENVGNGADSVGSL